MDEDDVEDATQADGTHVADQVLAVEDAQARPENGERRHGRLEVPPVAAPGRGLVVDGHAPGLGAHPAGSGAVGAEHQGHVALDGRHPAGQGHRLGHHAGEASMQGRQALGLGQGDGQGAVRL